MTQSNHNLQHEGIEVEGSSFDVASNTQDKKILNANQRLAVSALIRVAEMQRRSRVPLKVNCRRGNLVARYIVPSGANVLKAGMS